MSRSLCEDHPDYPPFEVTPYSIDHLVNLLAAKSGASPDVVHEKTHREYFECYFDYIKAKTIVVENYYVDKDYLEDFSEYYVSCFRHYRKKCTRLHFFDIEFSSLQFQNILSGKAQKRLRDLRKAYQGFVVVKPLPLTIVGRTCLRVYNDDDRRKYLGVIPYRVNLFGIELEVKSLAFQEQDRVLAACATSALWSAFQATAKLYRHPVLSPSAITKMASKHDQVHTRYFPNHGLTLSQIVGAVRELGLDPYKLSASDPFIFKAATYAFLRNRIPVLLVVTVVEECTKTVTDTETGQKKKIRFLKELGRHAVTITGYSMNGEKKKNGGDSWLLTASGIDKIYVHDDQVGPFARMELKKYPSRTLLKLQNGTETDIILGLTTSFGGGEKNGISVVPIAILVPLYKKIRISFETIHALVGGALQAISLVAPSTKLFSEEIEWDIYLSTVNDIKTEFLSSGEKGAQLREVLLQPMAKFLWRVQGRVGDNPVLDLIFDATDIEQACFLSYVKVGDRLIIDVIKKASELVTQAATKRIFDWIIDLADVDSPQADCPGENSTPSN